MSIVNLADCPYLKNLDFNLKSATILKKNIGIFFMKKIWIIATFDTKAEEALYLKHSIGQQAPLILVDLSTKPSQAKVDISPMDIAKHHPDGPEAVFSSDRGRSISEMARAFELFVQTRDDIGAMLGIGGSGGTALITPAMQALPIGTPKIMVSTMASGNIAPYVGVTDITMMYSVTDLAGLNRISKPILANAAGAIVGAFHQAAINQSLINKDTRPALGITMFGVTTPCVQYLTHKLHHQYDCLIFHATGTGGRSMEKLLDDGFLAGILDITTTEICDLLFDGVLACTEDRFGALIRTRKPGVLSLGALDMINFGAFETVPAKYQDRLFYKHNAQVTLMRTTEGENTQIGRWIAERLNQCDGPIHLLIPQGGLSALDAPGEPFWNPAANKALFDSLETHFKTSATHRLVRTPYHINDGDFADLLIQHFSEITEVYPEEITHA